MSSKNNVNPSHYKEEGRERPGQDINQEINKQKYTQSQTGQPMRNSQGGSEFIPGGGAPVINETPVKDLDKDSGQTAESANSSSSS